MTDDNHDDPGVHLVGFSAMSEMADRARMEAEVQQATVYRFLDELAPEQLVALRMILNQDSKSAMNNYWDGQVATLLRRIHGVDPWTGLTPQEAIERQGARR
jgi:hypothetical protein